MTKCGDFTDPPYSYPETSRTHTHRLHSDAVVLKLQPQTHAPSLILDAVKPLGASWAAAFIAVPPNQNPDTFALFRTQVCGGVVGYILVPNNRHTHTNTHTNTHTPHTHMPYKLP